MELTIVIDGHNFKGAPSYYLDSDEGVNCYGDEIEDGDHFAGFFNSEQEARDWAKERGHTIDEEPSNA